MELIWACELRYRPLTAPAVSSASQSRLHILLESRIGSDETENSGDADEILMRRYQRGSEQAFQHLYARHRAALMRFVRRLSPNTGDDEEIAQETWMAVIQGRERYMPQARFVTYLFSIARRRTMDRWRRIGRSPELEMDANEPDCLPGPSRNEPEVQTTNISLGADLLQAVAALPVLQREVFLLRAEAGLGIDEIAEVTGVNRETAKSRLRFALKKLRTALEPWA